MAVYTEISDDELQSFVAEYDIGEVVSYKGIAEGVENSNYLLRTATESFILTLYEKRVRETDLPYFLGLMEHLANAGIACPTPLHGRDGVALRRLCARPAAIVTFLDGMWPRRITPDHCYRLGAALAQLHLVGATFPGHRANDWSMASWQQLISQTQDRADTVRPGLAAVLAAETEYLSANWPSGLPDGVIHADLFPDNVFFLGGELSGLIDFYFACNDFLAYDLAICLNAWCFEGERNFNVTNARHLIQGYQLVRPLLTEEVSALPIFARGSALRFLLTRLYDWLNHDADAYVKPKDPMAFWARLRFHQQASGPSAYGLQWDESGHE